MSRRQQAAGRRQASRGQAGGRLAADWQAAGMQHAGPTASLCHAPPLGSCSLLPSAPPSVLHNLPLLLRRRGMFGGTRSRHVVHRLALFDAGGHLSHVISQSDVIKYVYDHVEELGPLADASISDIGFLKGAVISVRQGREAQCRGWAGQSMREVQW